MREKRERESVVLLDSQGGADGVAVTRSVARATVVIIRRRSRVKFLDDKVTIYLLHILRYRQLRRGNF